MQETHCLLYTPDCPPLIPCSSAGWYTVVQGHGFCLSLFRAAPGMQPQLSSLPPISTGGWTPCHPCAVALDCVMR